MSTSNSFLYSPLPNINEFAAIHINKIISRIKIITIEKKENLGFVVEHFFHFKIIIIFFWGDLIKRLYVQIIIKWQFLIKDKIISAFFINFIYLLFLVLIYDDIDSREIARVLRIKKRLFFDFFSSTRKWIFKYIFY